MCVNVPCMQGTLWTDAGPPRGLWGPGTNTQSGAPTIDGESGGTPPGIFFVFAILHALKCVLGASEAPFRAYIQYIHTCTYLPVAVFVSRFQIEKYDVQGPSQRLHSSQVCNI